MNYADYRGRIKSGDILVWSHREPPWKSLHDFKIWLVRLFQLSPYTHVGLAWVVSGRVFVIESVIPLVRVVPLSGLLPAYVISGTGLRKDQLEVALGMVGKAEYSQLEAVKAFFGRNTPNSDWECAEFVNHVLDTECDATPSAVVEHHLARGAKLVEVTR